MADTYPINTGTNKVAQSSYVPSTSFNYSFDPKRLIDFSTPYKFGDITKSKEPDTDPAELDLSTRDDSLFGNKYKMGNITGLASTLMQAAALPSMLKAAKLQNQTAQHNLDTGREEQARRNKNISGFNSLRSPQSAFAQG